MGLSGARTSGRTSCTFAATISTIHFRSNGAICKKCTGKWNASDKLRALNGSSESFLTASFLSPLTSHTDLVLLVTESFASPDKQRPKARRSDHERDSSSRFFWVSSASSVLETYASQVSWNSRPNFASSQGPLLRSLFPSACATLPRISAAWSRHNGVAVGPHARRRPGGRQDRGAHLCNRLVAFQPFNAPAPVPRHLAVNSRPAVDGTGARKNSRACMRQASAQHGNAPVISAGESAILAHKLGELLALGVVLIVLTNLDPCTLLEFAVTRVDTLLDHVSIQRDARAHGDLSSPSLVHGNAGRSEKWRDERGDMERRDDRGSEWWVQEEPAIAAAFSRDGFVIVPGALSSSDVSSFVAQLEAELSGSSGEAAELLYDRTGPGRISLNDRATWPTGKSRRVVECAPFPVAGASHWHSLRSSPALAQALDSIVGKGCWEMPFNGEPTERHPGWTVDHEPRHWYFPIVFPEHEYPPAAHSATSEAGRASPDARRRILLHSWRDELAVAPFTAEAQDARGRWQPVSRRRFRGKGWHIDVGPGFPNDGLRYAAGHPFQCVVLLLLLSDSDAGGGGTVMIPGSHRMVEAKLKNEEPAGVSHEDLNAWCVQQVLTAVKSETLCLVDGDFHTSIPDPGDGGGSGDELPRIATQIVGNSGDVVLMHPLMVHCGSTNLSSRVRIMGNGMVRLRRDVFEERGGMYFVNESTPAVAAHAPPSR